MNTEYRRDTNLLASLDAYAAGLPDPTPPLGPVPFTLEYVQVKVARLLEEAEGETWGGNFHESEDDLYQGLAQAVIDGNPDVVEMAKLLKSLTEETWHVTRYYS